MLMNSLPNSRQSTIGGAIANMDGGDRADGLGFDEVSKRLREIGTWEEVLAKNNEADATSSRSYSRSSSGAREAKRYQALRYY
ncbi:hypothetical protein ACE6H2_006959 [Prunus campanulata]